MGALKDLWQSERGLVAIALIIACTVLLFTGRITVDQWTTYTTLIFGTYVAGKTVTSTAAIIKAAPKPPLPGSDPLSSLLSAVLGNMSLPPVQTASSPVPPAPIPTSPPAPAPAPAPKDPS